MSGLLSANGHIELPAVVRADVEAFIAANTDSADRLRRVADYYGVTLRQPPILTQLEDSMREAATRDAAKSPRDKGRGGQEI
jgi:N-methylhydantoinase B/oxoprolinase/acetone carboxylase alpha subunit